MISADKILSESQLVKFFKKIKQEKDKSILALINSSKKNPKEVRIVFDYFLFSLIANTGLRISEALNLKWSDIHDDFLIIRPEVSKNKKRGTVYYGIKSQNLLAELKDFKSHLSNRKPTDYLFSINTKIPSRSYMHIRFKYWTSQTGLPSRLSIHSLRHTYGTMCLDKGLPLTFVRDNLRHSSVAVTSQYLHLTKESRDKVKDIF
ncbi:MAG: site-specific integrase [Deltaproteobacteria bacterium]|nr:site-specific integrase [Deltaproteobacteria bacterium]